MRRRCSCRWSSTCEKCALCAGCHPVVSGTGLVSAAADQGTSGSITISDALRNLSLLDLQMLQDPYGRQVVAVLMQMGTVWGYTP
ncbi:TPA: hypothetical protein ACJFTY_001023 [Escherichia coli]